MKKICIVGLGNMGKAILEVLRSKNLYEIITCGRADNPNSKLKDCDAFIIAVKPQNFEEFCGGLNIDLSSKIAISIMAGVPIEKMETLLGMKKIVRTFPNLPIKVGQSLTLWKGSGIDEDKLFIKEVLAAFGDQIELKEESEIETIGALCGCGPAYFAYLGEKMANLAEEFGLSKEDADKVAQQTFVGTGELIKASGWSLTSLRERVTSKGGVTEAAINAFEENNFEEVFKKGIEAAIKRTNEFSKN